MPTRSTSRHSSGQTISNAPICGGHWDLGAFIGAWSTPDEYRLSFADSSDSGWAGSTLLSHQLNADEARSHPRRDEFFEVAEIVIRDDPSAREHMDARPQT